jgi:flagellin-like hook-associated protein FlgL
MASDVTLSNSVRSNLLSLQNTADMLGRTQERLATGKKVNSALDNPSNFFTASSLSSRSSDLSSLLDAVSNSVQALKSADTGIKALTKFVESAKATARQALQAPNAYTSKPAVTSTGVTNAKADALTNISNKVTGKVGGLTEDTLVGAGKFELSTGNGTGANVGSITTTETSTVKDVISQINGIQGLSARLTDSGNLEINAADGTGVKIEATTQDRAIRIGTVPAGGALTASTAITTAGSFTVNGTTIGMSTTDTVQDVMDQMNAIEGVSASIVEGRLRIESQGANLVLDDATAAGVTTQLGLPDATGAAVSTTATAPASPPVPATTGNVSIANNVTAGDSLTVRIGEQEATFTFTAAVDGTNGTQYDDQASLVTAVNTKFNELNGTTGVEYASAGTAATDVVFTANKLADDIHVVKVDGDAATGDSNDYVDSAQASQGSAIVAKSLGLASTAPNALDGKSLTVTTGGGTPDERTVTVKFGVKTGEVNSIDALNKAFADAGVAVEGVVGTDGSLKIQSTNAAAGQTFELSGDAVGNGTTAGAFGSSASQTERDSSPATFGGPGDESRKALVKDFNDLLKQINVQAADSSYNGINLLAGDDLSVVFNENGTSKLDIKGVKFDAEGLGLNDIAESDFRDSDSVNAVIEKLDGALGKLRSQSSKFGSNLSIVETRQNFTKELINVLDTGAANLTLADTNEEGANALALQTRQQLSTTALSLSSQADQAVLRLF